MSSATSQGGLTMYCALSTDLQCIFPADPTVASTPTFVEPTLPSSGGRPRLFGLGSSPPIFAPSLGPTPTVSWATWQRRVPLAVCFRADPQVFLADPSLLPSPLSAEPPICVVPEQSPGLFGPESPRAPQVPTLVPDPKPPPSSWATWQRRPFYPADFSCAKFQNVVQADPSMAPSPPSIEPIILRGGSPGLFGPRSPRDSYVELSD